MLLKVRGEDYKNFQYPRSKRKAWRRLGLTNVREFDIDELQPVLATRGLPQTILQAMESYPHLKDEDVDDLVKIIKEHNQPSKFDSPIDEE